MKITIEASTKEIAAFLLEIRENWYSIKNGSLIKLYEKIGVRENN